jgi:hypothetical protein
VTVTVIAICQGQGELLFSNRSVPVDAGTEDAISHHLPDVRIVRVPSNPKYPSFVVPEQVVGFHISSLGGIAKIPPPRQKLHSLYGRLHDL